ncbi:PREDICTED: lanC-like protein 2 [Nicrophorus vespilloides]|uniref:LanC-like protein 2 n=1 Tax=Nicrophorus vespilloides TaxID=110193 RepID=A0ABM1MLS6_NICVS|nr:PREDICTED: lanC-like protein 2 [Nicrophorus vespilloides]
MAVSIHKIKKKFFPNPFPNFSTENAKDVIFGDTVRDNSIIKTSIEEKWCKTKDRIRHELKHNDLTVYTGTAGIALLYLRKAPNDLENLKEVRSFLKTNSIKSKRRLTFLCGDGGPLTIGAVVCHRLGEQNECKCLIKSLLSLKADAINSKSDLPSEYMYGRTGYLYCLLYLNKHISPPPIEGPTIRNVIEAILKIGQRYSKDGNHKCPLMYEWHGSNYLGAAHGLTGIVYLLLQAKEHLKEIELSDIVRPTVDYLATLQYPSGNYPSSLESQSGDKYVQWCHGAPGFVYMFSAAYKVFQDPHYLELALMAGDIVWQRGLLHKGYSLCHGVSGNAYCFLQLYQTTKDLKHLYRALKFCEWCINYTKEHEEYTPDRPVSLFEGISGPMYLLLDIQNPMEAKFPGYTL